MMGGGALSAVGADMTLTLSNNVDIAKHCYDLFAKGDIETLTRDFMAKDITWTEPNVEGLPGSGAHFSPEAVAKEVFGTVTEVFGDDFRIHPGTWHDAGDTVVLEGRFSGSLNGHDYEIPFCHVMTFKDGRLKRFHNYTNTWALMRMHE